MTMYSRSEAAKYFNVSTRTISRWLEKGLIKGHKLGYGPTSPLRIPESEIKSFLKKTSNKKK